MAKSAYRYEFAESLNLGDVEASLVQALFVMEQIHGETAARLDIGHSWDAVGRRCVIDSSRRIGIELNRLFVGLLTREFGPDRFYVERLDIPNADAIRNGGRNE